MDEKDIAETVLAADSGTLPGCFPIAAGQERLHSALPHGCRGERLVEFCLQQPISLRQLIGKGKHMELMIGTLSLMMVMVCGLLIYSVLLQFPAKEASAGLACMVAMAGNAPAKTSGTTLNRRIRYAALAFFILALLLSPCQSRYYSHRFLPAPLPAAASLPPATSTQH